MEILLLRKKSAEPPRPFKILEPMTHVELAWAYISLNSSESAKLRFGQTSNAFHPHFNRRIHTNDTKSSNDFWTVRDLL